MNDDSTATFVSKFKVNVENGETAEFDSHVDDQCYVRVVIQCGTKSSIISNFYLSCIYHDMIISLLRLTSVVSRSCLHICLERILTRSGQCCNSHAPDCVIGYSLRPVVTLRLLRSLNHIIIIIIIV